MYFPSKKDWWIGVALWIASSAIVWVEVLPILLTGNFRGPVSLIPISLVVLMVWIWFFTGYTITEKDLIVRCGPLSFKVGLGKIRRVRRTRHPLSAPALSLDRLDVEYGDGYTFISPADAETFLKLLQERCPQADIQY
jgi:hypothetical protein